MAGPATALVTGATSGIGRALAVELARRGHRVVVHGRSELGAQTTARDVHRITGGRVASVDADLARQDAVRDLAARVRERYPELTVVVHNAGVLRAGCSLVDGIEETFAVNHLASYLLTHELLGLLTANAPARIVYVGSVAHSWGRIHWDDLAGHTWYDPERSYAQSKLASLLTTGELARRVAGTGVTVLTVNPGSTRTGLGDDSSGVSRALGQLWRPFMRSPAAAARELADIATDPVLVRAHGTYLARGLVTHPAPRALDIPAQRRMWHLSATLTGVDARWPERALSA